jgi:phage FluMu protein gp41
MRYWSKGLARRSVLNIDCSAEATEISVEDGQAFLASVIPIERLRGELPPHGAQVIVAGDTQPPIVWRYIGILTTEDFENLMKLATDPGMVSFLIANPRGRRLFLRLARFLVVFSVQYVGTWLRVKFRRADRSGEPVQQAAGEVSSAPEPPGLLVSVAPESVGTEPAALNSRR